MAAFSPKSIWLCLGIAFLICVTRECLAGTGSGTPCKLALKDCGSKAGTLNSAVYNGTCEPPGKAILKQGSFASITFNFKTKQSEATLKSKVYGSISGLPFVPFPLGNPDACKNSGLTCPVAPNKNVDYSPVLEVKKEYPRVEVIVKWILEDASGSDVFCALMPAEIRA